MLRHDEMYEAWTVMKKISLGDIKNLPVQRLPAALLEQWEGTFSPEELYLAGHSMGGAACVSYSTWNHRIWFMSSRYMFFATVPRKVSTSCRSRKQSCSMCKWLNLLLLSATHRATFSPMRMTDVPTTVHDIPIFCINSESWTVWQNHLALLEAMLSQWSKGQPKGASMLLTIGIVITSVSSQCLAISPVGCEHQSFSDFPVLFPAYTSARGFLEDAHRLASVFLDGRLQEYLDANSDRVSHGLEIDNSDDHKWKKIRGRKRDFIVHNIV